MMEWLFNLMTKFAERIALVDKFGKDTSRTFKCLNRQF